MTLSVHALLFFILVAKGFAFPFGKSSVLGRADSLENKFSQGLALAGHVPPDNVLHFEADHAIADPDIPNLAKLLGLSSLLDLLAKAGLTNLLSGPGPFTVFGPTNEAFNSLPDWAKDLFTNNTMLANVLLFHVLPDNFPSISFVDELLVSTALKGKQLRVNIYTNTDDSNDVTVITAQCAPIDMSRVDNKALNGQIHVLNSVMIPPMGNIVQCIASCPVFKTLAAALKAAHLVQTLSGEGPFTLFAPSDTAFQKLPPDFLNWLMKNTTALQRVLKYHVVHLTYCSAGLLTGLYGQITTLAKQNITIHVSPGGIKVEDANMIVSDGSVSNGVIHVLDTVLIPPDVKLV